MHWNRAHLLLITGRFEEGWREYDWRFRCPGLSAYGRVFVATIDGKVMCLGK